MKRFILFITFCLYGQAFCAPSAEQDPKDPRFLAVTKCGALRLLPTQPRTDSLWKLGFATP